MHDGTYSFEIQLSNPQLTYVFDSEVETMDEAIETIFPMDTEYAIVKWNYHFIPIGYKYDVSCLYNDFREIINFCKNNILERIKFFFLLIVFLLLNPVSFLLSQEQTIVPAMEGEWISKTYEEHIKNTHSFQSGCKHLGRQYVSGISIYSSNDTVFATLIADLNDGIEHRLLRKKETKKHIYFELWQGNEFYGQALIYDKKHNSITFTDKRRKVYFTKTIGNPSNQLGGIERFLNHIILSGKYRGLKQELCFDDDGGITLNFDPGKYRILLDCTGKDLIEITIDDVTTIYEFRRDGKFLVLLHQGIGSQKVFAFNVDYLLCRYSD